jgi:cytochrome oxidase assembly protein ShyY1
VTDTAGRDRAPYRCLVLKLLRQPRYAALSVLMAVVAIVCVGAGSWQIARFDQKVHQNDDLRANAHAAAAPVSQLLPLVGGAADPSRARVEFRPVRVTGTYDAAAQSLVRNRTLDDQTGFLVVTPMRTGSTLLLVVRGFLAQPSSGAVPKAPAPPSGTVTIRARVQAPESRHDAAAQLTGGQVESINPGDQSARLGRPVYDGYVQLDAGQPGTARLQSLPSPDLSNPAGGALEPQHFAYVIQWYLFAALALAAPFAMARAELRQRRGPEADYDAGFDAAPDGSGAGDLPPTGAVGPADDAQLAGHVGSSDDAELTDDERRAAKLADRYGHAR